MTMDEKSLNITEEKISQIKEILPEAFSEGKIDWEKIKAILGEDIEFKRIKNKGDGFLYLLAVTSYAQKNFLERMIFLI